MEAAAESRPITSYAIVTADTARNRCAGCSKGIPVGALCFSKLERAGRHVKKKDATSTFWHQNCFIMPATLVKFPVECLRGWTQLAEKQQRRVRALFAAGEGATMRKVTEDMEKAKAAAATSNNDKNNNTNGNNTERSKKSNNTASTTAVANNTSLVASHANTQHNDKQHMRFD
ncbi:hypothetical protein BDF19DRAFT_400966 [Syncephalis fuscata]|nr:hypothetical protein BDF19DRAFT_400966 [Syncephalis fuscata]